MPFRAMQRIALTVTIGVAITATWRRAHRHPSAHQNQECCEQNFGVRRLAAAFESGSKLPHST